MFFLLSGNLKEQSAAQTPTGAYSMAAFVNLR
jgi:hypothetical protein